MVWIWEVLHLVPLHAFIHIRTCHIHHTHTEHTQLQILKNKIKKMVMHSYLLQNRKHQNKTQSSVVANKLSFTKSPLCISLYFFHKELEDCWCREGTATFLLNYHHWIVLQCQFLCPETARESNPFCPTWWICRAKYAAATTCQKRLDTRTAWANFRCSAKILVSDLPSSSRWVLDVTLGDTCIAHWCHRQTNPLVTLPLRKPAQIKHKLTICCGLDGRSPHRLMFTVLALQLGYLGWGMSSL